MLPSVGPLWYIKSVLPWCVTFRVRFFASPIPDRHAQMCICANMTSSTKSMPPEKDQATAIGLGKKHKIGEDWACSSGDKLVDRHTHTSFTSPLHYRPSPLRCFIPGLKPSFSANPFHRSLPSRLQDWLHRFPGLFTDISEHIRFLPFSSSLSRVLVVRFVR